MFKLYDLDKKQGLVGEFPTVDAAVTEASKRRIADAEIWDENDKCVAWKPKGHHTFIDAE